jgi:hypothetical protein
MAYRGVERVEYSLTNSLTRLGLPYPGMERNVLRQFQKYAHRDIVDRNGDWHWLSVAQHHGLPTRLLDWTFSPLVALHFAVADPEKYPDKPAAVWMVNYTEAHRLLLKRDTDVLRHHGGAIFSVDALAESFKGLDELDGSVSAAHPGTIAVFFEPNTIDDRIANQFAFFSALSDPWMPFEEWLAQDHVKNMVTAKKVIISPGKRSDPKSNLKWEIRDRLDQSNINERVLFPGLDGLCKWLARQNKARP